MSFTDIVHGAFAAILSGYGEFAVSVAIRGTKGTGLRVNQAEQTNFTERGEVGMVSGTVRVNGSTFARPDRGETIVVDGDPVIVTDTDGSGILHVIQYQVVRKVSEV